MEGVIEMRAKVADLVSQILQGKPQLEESRVNGGESDATLRLSGAATMTPH